MRADGSPPACGDIVVMTREAIWPDENGEKWVNVYHEPWADHCARRVFAYPRTLIGYGLRVLWVNVKRRLRGEPKVDRFTYVSEALVSRKP
jgi:hypothetical protein